MYSEEFIKRFWEKVDKKPDGCWLWTGSSSGGYGQVMRRVNGVLIGKYVHRVSLELHLGREIAWGMVAAHQPIVCHNRLCVNPDHLREATHSENVLDKHLDGTMPDTKGQNNAQCKLTVEQVIAIRGDERKQKDIAADYGISRENVSAIKRRKSWAHIN
jgi:hypothetical protein